jgi:hypothetical protein
VRTHPRPHASMFAGVVAGETELALAAVEAAGVAASSAPEPAYAIT